MPTKQKPFEELKKENKDILPLWILIVSGIILLLLVIVFIVGYKLGIKTC